MVPETVVAEAEEVMNFALFRLHLRVAHDRFQRLHRFLIVLLVEVALANLGARKKRLIGAGSIGDDLSEEFTCLSVSSESNAGKRLVHSDLCCVFGLREEKERRIGNQEGVLVVARAVVVADREKVSLDEREFDLLRLRAERFGVEEILLRRLEIRFFLLVRLRNLVLELCLKRL